MICFKQQSCFLFIFHLQLVLQLLILLMSIFSCKAENEQPISDRFVGYILIARGQFSLNIFLQLLQSPIFQIQILQGRLKGFFHLGHFHKIQRHKLLFSQILTPQTIWWFPIDCSFIFILECTIEYLIDKDTEIFQNTQSTTKNIVSFLWVEHSVLVCMQVDLSVIKVLS